MSHPCSSRGEGKAEAVRDSCVVSWRVGSMAALVGTLGGSKEGQGLQASGLGGWVIPSTETKEQVREKGWVQIWGYSVLAW